jgi:hypothetical protein
VPLKAGLFGDTVPQHVGTCA